MPEDRLVADINHRFGFIFGLLLKTRSGASTQDNRLHSVELYNMDDKFKAAVAILVGSVIGGAVSSVIKIALINIPPLSFSFLRFFIASFFVLPFFLKEKVRFDKHFLSLVLATILAVFNIAVFAYGVRLTTASIGQMLYAGTPILAGVFSYFILKEKLSLRKWFFIFLGLVGTVLVVLLPLFEKGSSFSGNLMGNLLISVGVISWSMYFVLSKHYQKKYSPIVITSVFIFLSTLLFLPLSISESATQDSWWQNLPLISIYAVLYIAIPGTVVVYWLNQYAIKHGGPILASLSFYLLPIFAYTSAFVLLGEKLTQGLIIGTILVFTSVTLTTYSK